MNDEPSTPEQHALIRIRATERVRYIIWLANRLERAADCPRIRKAAADELRMLIGADGAPDILALGVKR